MPGSLGKPTSVPRRVRPRVRFVMDAEALALIYPRALRDEIGRHVDEVAQPCTAADVVAEPALLAEVELLFTGWGAPQLDAALLRQAPKLQAVFHGAGSVRSFMSEAAWARGVRITCAAAANAVPVAEFTIAQVVMCLKRIWQQAHAMKADRRWQQTDPGATCYGSKVGLVSLGEIGRRVAERLADMDVQVCVYDIEHDRALARRLGFEYVALEELFATCDVVSLHTPSLPETQQLIGERLLRSLKPGASLINTARGEVMDEAALVRLLQHRPDVLAVLDVTDPEPPTPDSALWDLPNVILTPHIAGSRGAECQRMGRAMLAELRRYLAGQPLRWEVTEHRIAYMA